MTKQKFNIGDTVYIRTSNDNYFTNVISGVRLDANDTYIYYLQNGMRVFESSILSSLDDAYTKEMKEEEERHLKAKQAITEKFSELKKKGTKLNDKIGTDYDVDKIYVKPVKDSDNAAELFNKMMKAYEDLCERMKF